jgi:hypothetical protein
MRPSLLASEPSLTYTLIRSWCRSTFKTLLIVFPELLFLENCVMRGGPLVNIVPFIRLFYGVHSSLYYQHGWHVEGVTIIKSSSNMKHDDPLRGPLFVLAHNWTFLKTIMWALSCIFPSLVDNTHIVGLMNEIIRTFDHFSTQLALVGFKVKVSKCKLWSPFKIFPCIKIL